MQSTGIAHKGRRPSAGAQPRTSVRAPTHTVIRQPMPRHRGEEELAADPRRRRHAAEQGGEDEGDGGEADPLDHRSWFARLGVAPRRR